MAGRPDPLNQDPGLPHCVQGRKRLRRGQAFSSRIRRPLLSVGACNGHLPALSLLNIIPTMYRSMSSIEFTQRPCSLELLQPFCLVVEVRIPVIAATVVRCFSLSTGKSTLEGPPWSPCCSIPSAGTNGRPSSPVVAHAVSASKVLSSR
jgi:hypothetical protein